MKGAFCHLKDDQALPVRVGSGSPSAGVRLALDDPLIEEWHSTDELPPFSAFPDGLLSNTEGAKNVDETNLPLDDPSQTAQDFFPDDRGFWTNKKGEHR